MQSMARVAMAGLALACAFMHPAQAKDILFDIEGQIQSVFQHPQRPVITGVTVGTPFQARLSYNLETQDVCAGPEHGCYAHIPGGQYGLTLMVATYTFRSDPAFQLNVNVNDASQVNPPCCFADNFDVNALNTLCDGLVLDEVSMNVIMDDYTNSVYTSDALPAAFDLASFSLTVIDVSGARLDGASFSFRAAITSMKENPAHALGSLRTELGAMSIANGLRRSLDAKLAAARAALENDPGGNGAQVAENLIDAFINEVFAKRGRGLTEAQADTLLAEAERILTLLP